jgi:adenylyltransferase/sulfurtransferase
MSIIQDFLRYNRQVMLPSYEAGQAKIKKPKFYLLAGGLGCPILQY